MAIASLPTPDDTDDMNTSQGRPLRRLFPYEQQMRWVLRIYILGMVFLGDSFDEARARSSTLTSIERNKKTTAAGIKQMLTETQTRFK